MKTSEALRIKKPKYQEHESIPGIAKRIRSSKRNFLSSYSNFEIDAEQLLNVSCGNEKLVKEVQELIEERQKEDQTVGGFLAIGIYRISREEVISQDKSEWIHVVFDHGHGITLIAGRIGRADWTHRQFMDKSLVYSMANMLIDG